MGNQNRWTGIVVVVFMGLLFSVPVVLAGSLESSGGPNEAGSQMVTLEQIYDRINNGVAAIKMDKFTEPSSGPTAGTMHTLDDIYALAGLRAPVTRTGQTICNNSGGTIVPCAGTGQDGDLKRGVAWPVPRFTDNSNGTVTDNLTGLIWLKNANCTDTVGEIIKTTGVLTWADALTWSNNLAGGRCGLTDGSNIGQWRLPNLREMQSLIHYGFNVPALSNTHGSSQWTEGVPFTGVKRFPYWSSTKNAAFPSNAWYVDLGSGGVSIDVKTNTSYVWPVRGGQ